MTRLSTMRIAQLAGVSREEAFRLLLENGLLSGEPGGWKLTEQGQSVGEMRYEDNGCGGFARRSWEYPVWDEAVAYMIGDPEAHLRDVNANRRAAGLEELGSLK